MLSRILRTATRSCHEIKSFRVYSSGQEKLLNNLQFKSKITPKLNEKLQEITLKHQNLNKKLNENINKLSSKEIASISKELSNTLNISSFYTEIQKSRKELKDLEEVRDFEEVDMRELAEEEIQEVIEKLQGLEEDILGEIVPKQPVDQNDVILEIRAGTGGDEATLFAAELFKMYERYCALKKWKISPLSASEENGITKETIAEISGRGVYGKLKFESGVHRVQRVPVTENQGRIHTSTVTVAILPQATNVKIEINPNDLRIDSFRASGKGGQNVNTTDSAVRITHIPTGISVANQEERSQLQNKEKAMKILRARIFDIEQQKIASERRNARNSMIGKGDRSEKCRTYNFAQNRVTDHRINYSIYNIEGVMQGIFLDEIIDQLRMENDLDELARFADSSETKVD
ncbi:hypothetical protein BB559_000893 [Furculomyces boomerangus]|uniref:Prokaryotic-type class I peptide chain release factors domain-containing protein n=1 Tax=Furculomyces boomerangus TaxID=61424 RepID=A0A2T9Z3W4_9FUNG|nr:hypothetical protein BB559_000893 [Furculomyces boomerangus]